MSQGYRHLFGPVPSRRLGRSLGIDVIPPKTCSFDCIYCQCGCTTQATAQRKEWIPLDELRDEFKTWLIRDGAADAVAFAGCGEPTLYSRLGEMIAFIREQCTLPVAVLSNGSLLHHEAVRNDLLDAHIVKVTLSAWNDASFQKIHHPVQGITFSKVLAGQRDFRAIYKGHLWVEVFFVDGVNTAPEQAQRIADAVASLQPDRIHLNTAVRPASDSGIQPVPAARMNRLCEYFTPRAEVVASFPASTPPSGLLPDAATLAALVKRHPATAEQLATQYGVHPAAVRKILSQPPFIAELRGSETYYLCR